MTQPSELEAALAASVAIYQAAQEQAAATATGIAEQLPAVVGVVNANQAAVRERAAALANQQLRRLFVGLDVWDGDAVQQFTEDGAQILAVAQTATARAAAAAQDAQLAAMGVRSTTTPSDPMDVRGRVRVTTNGVDVQPRAAVVDYEGRPKVRVTVDDMSTAGVLNRPARTVRAVVASGIDPVVARERGATRLEQIVDTNLMLAQRLAEHEALAQAVDLDDRVIGYRRVIHAEKSRGGSCGLCIAAAQRIYKTNTLRAVHDRCWCSITAVTKDFDPGKHLNTVDLKDLYKDADGNTAADLKRTRYQVDEHGELGAVLVPKRRQTDKAPAAAGGGRGGEPPKQPPLAPPTGSPDDPAPGSVDRSQVRNVKQHELDTAGRIAKLGHDVTFRPMTDSTDTADVLIGGKKWDFKSPTSAARNTVSARVVGKIDIQGGNVVLDLSRSPMAWDTGSALVEDLLRRYDDLNNVWLIKQDGDAVRSNIFGKESPT